ncbi:MAG: YkgJ family cysteine cluster protein [Methanoregula sp.]
MGEIIEILEEISPLCFRIGYMTTCEERTVVVDPDKKALFLKCEQTAKQSLACPFLREAAPGKIICTVHSSRPDICRQYSCFRIMVLDDEGKRMGKVSHNTRCLITMDHKLREIWDRDISKIQTNDETFWEEHVGEALSGHGYRVIK